MAHFIFIDDEEEAGEVSSLTHSLFKRNPPPVDPPVALKLNMLTETPMLCSLECKKTLKLTVSSLSIQNNNSHKAFFLLK